MKTPIVSIIAALSENNAIGKENKLLWHIPADLKRFKTITSGHPVIMGRKTYESIGRLLPNRLNIIVTRDPSFTVMGGVVTSSLVTAIERASKEDTDEVFIIGGGQIYSQGIKRADKLYLTLIHTNIEGDAFFPDYSDFTKKVFELSGESEGYRYTFLELIR